MPTQDIIPQEKRAAVAHALRETFGVSDLEDIHTLTGGLTSSLVFRILVQGSPFVLKIITRPYTANTLTRYFACMQSAAEAGLAPPVRYTSVEDRISITDFVSPVPFPITEALARMPTLLRTLHALPPFPRVEDHLNTSCLFLLNKGPALDGFFQSFKAANILPPAETEQLSALHAQLTAAYPYPDAEMMSSHNDLLRPENILFDGHRVWLIDWEAAFLNDRYADLAVVANFVVTNDAEETAYLREYFGQWPDEYQRARFFLMQQLAHLFYAMGFLFLGSSGKPVDLSKPVPAFRDFHQRIWAGEVDLADKPTKVVYGRVHWQKLLQNTRQPRFSDSLKIVSNR